MRLGAFLISEKVVMAVILTNAVVMTASGFYAESSTAFEILGRIDYACVAFFVIEAALKIHHLGFSGYFARNWNRFDFFVVALCLPILWSPFFELSRGFAWAPIIRTGRLFRLFRLLRFIPNIDHLLLGSRRALRASVGVFLALFLVNLILALSATFLFGDVSPELFGDPARSFYSIFRIFTVEGWNDFPDTLEAGSSSGAWIFGIRVFFMFAVLTGGILGFSLANAVFLDEMTMDNNRQLEEKVDALAEQIAVLQEDLRQALGHDRTR